MPTKLTSTIKRTIRVHGVESDVLVWLSESGIEMSIPGFKTKIGQTWTGIVERMLTPPNVQSFLEGKPYEFLKYYAAKRAKKKGDNV